MLIFLILVMSDQSQNQGTSVQKTETSNAYPNWSQPMNWAYGR